MCRTNQDASRLWGGCVASGRSSTTGGVKGKHGDEFAYYVCGGRHQGRKCSLPYLPAPHVEDNVVRGWPLWVRMHEVDAEAAEVALQDKLNLGSADRAETRQRAARQMKVLDDQRRKLVQMAYADAIPLDLLKTEQDRIGREQLAAQRALAQAETEHEDISETFRQAVTLMRLGPAIYQQATPEIRRMLNRAFLVRIELDVKETGTMLAQPWASMERVVRHTRELRLADMADVTCITEGSGLGPSEGPETTDPGHEDHDRGSSMNPLVDLTHHNKNRLILVQGPEITVRPVSTRLLARDDAP